MESTGFSFFLNRSRDPERYPKHKHDCCEIVYYVDAEGTTFIGDQEYPISPNTVAFIPAELPHSDLYRRTSQVYCAGFYSDNPAEPTVINDTEGDFAVFFEEIEKELKQNLNNGNSIINKCIDIILLKLLRYDQTPDTDSNTHQRLGYTAQYIKSNASMNVDFHKLASSIGYSYDHFRHLFTDIYGCSPKQYLLNARIDRAKHLLRNTDEKIKSIAMECGFRQSSQFVAFFKKSVGMTPAFYRSRNKIDDLVEA
ncbi:MAG: AraC family transcriptional regulator [Ruminococcaceae bacterium]|nr:AraC family transcriptional regulator [Oscillospiraceae bacterium]